MKKLTVPYAALLAVTMSSALAFASPGSAVIRGSIIATGGACSSGFHIKGTDIHSDKDVLICASTPEQKIFYGPTLAREMAADSSLDVLTALSKKGVMMFSVQSVEGTLDWTIETAELVTQ